MCLLLTPTRRSIFFFRFGQLMTAAASEETADGNRHVFFAPLSVRWIDCRRRVLYDMVKVNRMCRDLSASVASTLHTVRLVRRLLLCVYEQTDEFNYICDVSADYENNKLYLFKWQTSTESYIRIYFGRRKCHSRPPLNDASRCDLLVILPRTETPILFLEHALIMQKHILIDGAVSGKRALPLTITYAVRDDVEQRAFTPFGRNGYNFPHFFFFFFACRVDAHFQHSDVRSSFKMSQTEN